MRTLDSVASGSSAGLVATSYVASCPKDKRAVHALKLDQLITYYLH